VSDGDRRARWFWIGGGLVVVAAVLLLGLLLPFLESINLPDRIELAPGVVTVWSGSIDDFQALVDAAAVAGEPAVGTFGAFEPGLAGAWAVTETTLDADHSISYLQYRCDWNPLCDRDLVVVIEPTSSATSR